MSTAGLPTVSVIIPVRNGEGWIDACLDAVLSQDYAGELEVVVADGASTDRTRKILEARGKDDPRIRIVDNPEGSTPAGLNAALRETEGRIIARCDAHAVLPTDYISRATELLESTAAWVVGGVQRAVGETYVERSIAMAMTSRFGVGDSRFHYGGEEGATDTVYLGVFPRKVFEEVGLYDEALLRNQDYELNWRIRQHGGVVYLHPDLEVRYRPRGSLRALWRQYFDYGRWKRRALMTHPRSLRWRQLAPPLLVLGLAGSVVLAATQRSKFAWLVPAVYSGAVGAASALSGARRRDSAALLLPAVFPTIHLGWGLGFLMGRIRTPAGTPAPGNSPSGLS